MIIVVSDVHLGHERCNRDSFTDFVHYLTEEDFDYLVLLGDVIDFWRRGDSRCLTSITYSDPLTKWELMYNVVLQKSKQEPLNRSDQTLKE